MCVCDCSFRRCTRERSVCVLLTGYTLTPSTGPVCVLSTTQEHHLSVNLCVYKLHKVRGRGGGGGGS